MALCVMTGIWSQNCSQGQGLCERTETTAQVGWGTSSINEPQPKIKYKAGFEKPSRNSLYTPDTQTFQNFTSRSSCKCPHSQKHSHQKPALIKSHTCAYQLQDLAGYNRALMPPLDNTDFSSAWRQVNNNTSSQSCAYHQSEQDLEPKKQFHCHTCPRQRKKSSTPAPPPPQMCQQQQRRSRSASAKPRRNSSYHSYDDLDSRSAVLNAERKVVASLKYLCACTGATLRNLSKKTKDLHAKNYTYTKVIMTNRVY